MADREPVSSLPFVSVVVPALNCAEDVDGFVAAMKRQDYPADRFEVIVVDNGSTDDTYDRLQAAGLIALQRLEKGRARALNTGIETARGSIILTTDLSCRAEPQWISAVVAAFAAHPRAGCVAGDIKLLRTTSSWVIDFQERSDYMSPFLALSRTHLPFMPFADGANASFRRQLFDEIGGFEEAFVKAADVEICYRMFVLTDYTLVFNRAALVWEPGEPSLRALLRQRFRMGVGSNLMRMKYPLLYENAPWRFDVRQGWWGVRAGIVNSARLASLNLGLLLGHNRHKAIDADIRQLMSWAQSLGRHYGRRWLRQRKIAPIAVNSGRIRAFLANTRPLEGRIALADIAATPAAILPDSAAAELAVEKTRRTSPR